MAGGIMDLGKLVATFGLNTAPMTAGVNAANKKLASLNKQAMIVGRTMTRFVTLPMALAGAAAVSTQKNFEASMTKIIGLVGVSREQVEKWNKEVLAMANATGRGPEELADALYFVTSAGIRGAEAMEVLEMAAKGAAVGMGDTKVIADLVTSAMNAYGKENLSASQATDILAASIREGKAEADELAGAMGMVLPIASEYGVSFDQVGAAFAGMTRTGTNARVAATQLKAILSAMASPSMQAADAMAEYGTNAETFRKTVREQGLIKALLDLREATAGNEAAMAEIFPNIRALMGTLDLLGKNVDYNVQIFEALTNASGSLERAFAEVGGTTQQKLNVAMATLKTTLIEVGNLIKGPLVKILSSVNDKFAEVTRTMGTMSDQQKKLTFAMAALTAAAGPLTLIMSRLVQIVMLNPWTAAAAAIAVVTAAVVKYAVAQQTATKIARQSKNQRDELVSNIDREVFAVEKLAHTLKTAEKGSEEWTAAKNKMNSQYGSYLKKVITEKMTQEELAKALEDVTNARYADVAAQQYAGEATRLMDQYINEFTKATKKWSKLVQENSRELLKETGKTPADFTRALYEGIETSAQMLEEGSPMSDVTDYLHKAAGDVYDTFIADLEDAPKRKTAKNDFMGNVMKSLSLRIGTGEQVNILKEMTEGLQSAFKTEPVVVDVKADLGKIEQDINYLKATTEEMSKQEYLMAMIALEKKKSALLTGDLKTENDKVIDSLEEELRIHNRIKSTLGQEAQAEAVIEKIKKERKKLSGDDLTANSKALNNAERELEVLQIQTSALNEQAKAAEMLRVHEEQLSTLSGERLKTATTQLQQDKLQYDLLVSQNSGLNTEQQLLQQIAAYKEYGLTLDGKAREENKAIVEEKEKEARLEAQRYADTGKLGKLQYDLQELEREAAKLSEDKAAKKQEEIRAKEEEVRLEEESIQGLNEITRLENSINQMKEENQRLTGEDLKANKEKILTEQIRLMNLQMEKGMLTDIEKKQLSIAKIELLRLQATDPVRAAALRKELEALQAELSGMEGDTEAGAGVEFETKGSGAWFKAMNEKIQLQKDVVAQLIEEGKEGTKAHKSAVKDLKASQKQKLDAYLGYFNAVLGAASTFTTAMGGLFEAQKQRELSAAGDNARRREQIEKKYYEKQKRWAIAQAMINTALGATNALQGPPIYKWIELAAVLAAGAVQVATIKAQSFAQGGIISGPTLGLMGEYPGARNNPEVIAPLDKLKSMLQPQRSSMGIPKEIKLVMEGRDAVAWVDFNRMLNNTY